jgi:hypothetical protein
MRAAARRRARVHRSRPAELTIEAVESYREAAIRLLENMRPVIERQAKATLAAWQTRSAMWNCAPPPDLF